MSSSESEPEEKAAIDQRGHLQREELQLRRWARERALLSSYKTARRNKARKGHTTITNKGKFGGTVATGASLSPSSPSSAPESVALIPDDELSAADDECCDTEKAHTTPVIAHTAESGTGDADAQQVPTPMHTAREEARLAELQDRLALREKLLDAREDAVIHSEAEHRLALMLRDKLFERERNLELREAALASRAASIDAEIREGQDAERAKLSLLLEQSASLARHLEEEVATREAALARRSDEVDARESLMRDELASLQSEFERLSGELQSREAYLLRAHEERSAAAERMEASIIDEANARSAALIERETAIAEAAQRHVDICAKREAQLAADKLAAIAELAAKAKADAAALESRAIQSRADHETSLRVLQARELEVAAKLAELMDVEAQARMTDKSGATSARRQQQQQQQQQRFGTPQAHYSDALDSAADATQRLLLSAPGGLISSNSDYVHSPSNHSNPALASPLRFAEAVRSPRLNPGAVAATTASDGGSNALLASALHGHADNSPFFEGANGGGGDSSSRATTATLYPPFSGSNSSAGSRIGTDRSTERDTFVTYQHQSASPTGRGLPRASNEVEVAPRVLPPRDVSVADGSSSVGDWRSYYESQFGLGRSGGTASSSHGQLDGASGSRSSPIRYSTNGNGAGPLGEPQLRSPSTRSLFTVDNHPVPSTAASSSLSYNSRDSNYIQSHGASSDTTTKGRTSELSRGGNPFLMRAQAELGAAIASATTVASPKRPLMYSAYGVPIWGPG